MKRISLFGFCVALAACNSQNHPAQSVSKGAETPSRSTQELAANHPTPKPTEAEKVEVKAAEAARFGDPITSAQAVSLADIAKSPAAFKGKTIVTTGVVASVCQERGCWMEIRDTEKSANIRFHGHSFFVPKTSSGKKARVQGTIMLMKDGRECDEMSSTGAQLQMDATGVELM